MALVRNIASLNSSIFRERHVTSRGRLLSGSRDAIFCNTGTSAGGCRVGSTASGACRNGHTASLDVESVTLHLLVAPMGRPQALLFKRLGLDETVFAKAGNAARVERAV